MARCSNDHEVPDGKHFCGRCGTEMVVACPEGHTTGASNQFCTECGAPLSPRQDEGTASDNPIDDAGPGATKADDHPPAPAPSPDSRLDDPPPPCGQSRWRGAPQATIVGLVGVGVVVALVAALAFRRGDGGGGSDGGEGVGTQVELAQQVLQERCDIPGDGSLEHLNTLPGDDELTEISFTTSEDFVGTVYVDAHSEFLDEVDCPGSAENDIEVPPEWEGVGDPVEYLVAIECGFGPETRFDLELVSISDPRPGEQTTWEIGLPDGTVGRLLPNGEVECPTPPPAAGNEDLVLSGDGLGAVEFGDDAAEAISTVSELFGSPSSDETYSPGGCPPPVTRSVVWPDSAMVIYLSGDGEFVGYHFSGRGSAAYGLVTSDGVALGDTLSDLTDSYGAALGLTENGFFTVNDGTETGLEGFLSGEPQPETVDGFFAGSDCTFE